MVPWSSGSGSGFGLGSAEAVFAADPQGSGVERVWAHLRAIVGNAVSNAITDLLVDLLLDHVPVVPPICGLKGP